MDKLKLENKSLEKKFKDKENEYNEYVNKINTIKSVLEKILGIKKHDKFHQ